jgi:uncharacterized protein YndB with AHSA1/START domain
MDKVFKALADPTRRYVLDELRQRNGQTLGELCGRVDMARQSVSQHIDLLEEANLISTQRSGREKLHYINPVPIYEIQERWIQKFEQSRLKTISNVKKRAEETTAMSKETLPTYVYVTYINATPEAVWEALTDADLSGQYWGHHNVSDWKVGSEWKHIRTDGSGIADAVGTIIETDHPRKLVMTFESPIDAHPSTTVTFLIEPHRQIVRLTVTHENLEDEPFRAISAGWPTVMANLKSLLDTGKPLPTDPWEMHAELRAEQLAKHGQS